MSSQSGESSSQVARRPPIITWQAAVGDSLQHDAGTPSARKRKHVSSACTSCKQAKAKCDGNDPCDRCRRTSQECSYDAEHDGRRGHARDRKDAKLLDDLLTAVRTIPPDRLDHLMLLMRSDAEPKDIKARISNELSMLQATSSSLRNFHDSVELNWYRRHLYRREGLEVNRLVDGPPYQVSGRQWTAVTHDDQLISHLVSLWLIWEKPFYNWMDSKQFLHDMRNGTPQSRYCSRLLVNAILASACAYSDYRDARTVRGAVSPLMQSFIAEARQHLEEEILKPPSVTTVQGLGILLLTVALAGQDRLGFSMMMQVIAMSEELERQSSRLPDDTDDARDYARIVSLTCWAVYNMSSAVFMSFMKPQFMRTPKIKPSVSSSDDLWISYPYHLDPIASYDDELVQVFCDVQIIAHSLSQVLFDDTQELSPHVQEQQVLALHRRLLDILQAIPPHLSAREGASPPVLLHHIWYQTIVLRMYLALQTSDFGPSMIMQAQSICIESAICVSEILQLYSRVYGFELVKNTIAQTISLSLFVLLKAPERMTYDLHIATLFYCLRSMSHRWPMLMGIFYMVQHYAKQEQYEFPPDINGMLIEFHGEWQRRRTRKLASIYPQPAVMTQSALIEGNARDMGSFLEQVAEPGITVEHEEVGTE